MTTEQRTQAERADPPDTGNDVGHLQDVVQRLEELAEGQERVTVADAVEVIEERSFAPLLLLPGLIMVAPGIGDIPGVPVLMGMFVILVSVQLVMRRRTLWLPGWFGRRSVRSKTVKKSLSWLHRPARFLDRWTKPRYEQLVGHASIFVIAAVCIAVAAATPIMEVVPFSANVAGAAILAFGLALVARDGLLAMIAIAFSVATLGLLVYQLM